MRRTILPIILFMAFTSPVQSADPIIGDWLTPKGETAAIAACRSGSFCVTLKTGQYAGKQIGSMKIKGNGYAGKVTDPANDKTYNGKASIAGDVLNMKGCVLSGLICRTQKWSRQ